MTTTTASRAAHPLTWWFALVVVVVSWLVAAVARGVIAVVASAYARQQMPGPESLMIVAAFALVMGYIVAVGGVGFGMRNRIDGGKFTLIFALTLAAVHVFSGLTWGMGILAPSANDAYALVFVPLLYTVPAATVRLIRWWWIAVVLAVSVVVSSVLFALMAAS